MYAVRYPVGSSYRYVLRGDGWWLFRSEAEAQPIADYLRMWQLVAAIIVKVT